jgi:hypothetical protein
MDGSGMARESRRAKMRASAQYSALNGTPRLMRAMEEFFAAVEDEFGVEVANSRNLETPGDVIDYVCESTRPADGMTDDEHRDHVASVMGELLAQTLGVTRYSESTRFQDMRGR